jgi:aerobic carbon-monoxide dehydrogenase medium subunit
VKPAPFRYHRPESLADALGLLFRLPSSKLIAGGQSLGPMMNMRLVTPAELIDLNAIAGMDGMAEKGDFIEIGALARHHAVASSPVVRKHCPLLAEAAATIGHYAIRARGTLGGSLAHADPAAQLPLVAATLGAEIIVNGKRGERRIPAQDFFISMMTTALEPDEIIVAARFPKHERHAYRQFSRRTGDFAIVAVACAKQSNVLKIGVGGVEDKPRVFSDPAETRKLNPVENPRVPALYRKELVEALVKRCMTSI